jgi:hypothetical protein
MPATLLQLDPPIPVLARVDNVWHKALAHGWLDYGIEDYLLWIVFLDDGRQWTVRNTHILAQSNATIERKVTP